MGVFPVASTHLNTAVGGNNYFQYPFEKFLLQIAAVMINIPIGHMYGWILQFLPDRHSCTKIWMIPLVHTTHHLLRRGRNDGHPVLPTVCQLSERMCRSSGKHVNQDRILKIYTGGVRILCYATKLNPTITNYLLHIAQRSVITEGDILDTWRQHCAKPMACTRSSVNACTQ